MRITPPMLLVFALGSTLAVLAAQQTLTVPADHPTVQAAIVAAVPGDTVLVLPGIYNECINFLGKDIAVIGIGGPEATTLQAGGPQNSVVSFVSGEGAGAVLKGFTVTGGFGTPEPFTIWGSIIAHGGGIHIINSSPVIEDCIVRNNYAIDIPDIPDYHFPPVSSGGGIRVFSSAPGLSSPLIRNCVVRQNIANNSAGILSIDSNTIIENCLIDNNNAQASQSNGASGPGGLTFQGGIHVARRCKIVGNRGSVGGLVMNAGANVFLENCLIMKNWGQFTHAFQASGSTKMLHCTVSANGSLGESLSTAVAAINGYLEVRNSVIRTHPMQPAVPLSGSTVWHSSVTGMPILPGSGNMNVDPRFIDPFSATDPDLHLDVTSPCINKATTVLPATMSMPTVDVDGNPRIFDGAPDMGAYEFVAGLFKAGAGTVNQNSGGPVDVLFVNGSAGGPIRRVDVTMGSVTALNVLTAPGSSMSPFILWSCYGVASAYTRYYTVLGDICFVPAIVDPLHPALDTVANAFWSDPGALFPAQPAPWTRFFYAPWFPVRFTVQGIIQQSPGVYAITNGLVLNVVAP